MAAPRRPLPTPPAAPQVYEADIDAYEPLGLPSAYPYSSYISPFPYPSAFSRPAPQVYNDEPSALRGGTLLHKGFYDLLALIPSTPSPSRLFWRGGQDAEPVAGPRYEEIPPGELPRPKVLQPAPASPGAPSSPPAKNLKARRISKDMVSKPTGIMYVQGRSAFTSRLKYTSLDISCTRLTLTRLKPSCLAGGLRARESWEVSSLILFHPALPAHVP